MVAMMSHKNQTFKQLFILVSVNITCDDIISVTCLISGVSVCIFTWVFKIYILSFIISPKFSLMVTIKTKEM